MSDRLFVATRNGVFTVARRTGRARPRWTIARAQFLGDNASMVLPDRREGSVYVALGHGHFGVKLHRSQDGGRSWEPCATPAYPPKPEGLDEREPNSGRPILWNTELVWALERGHESEPGTLWCGTSCQADGMRAAYMPPERQGDPDVQDPHHMVQCRANPDVLWVQHHNGVFRSTDGAVSWHEIETVKPAAFGFAVAVHPDDPDTAWFVPGVSDKHRIPVKGRVAVARTRNGGRSFQVLTQGLPQIHAYDLTYRHGLDVDETGDRLAFGTTTGSLWVSEDQGDSWETVAEHLPPVYCVRFG